MKTITAEEINNFEKIYRLNLINSISGYKPANLIGTKGEGGENLTIISSVIHLGSNPALLGFIMRPEKVDRHTLTNLKASGFFTINQIHQGMEERAHYTSAKFDRSVSEFEACHLKAEYLNGFQAPYVKESKLKLGLKVAEIKSIEINQTVLIIGSVEVIHLDETALLKDGQLDLNLYQTLCISGLNRYHQVSEIANFPYARVEELPNFNR